MKKSDKTRDVRKDIARRLMSAISPGPQFDMTGPPDRYRLAATMLVLGQIQIATRSALDELGVAEDAAPGWAWIPGPDGRRELCAVLDEEPERY